MIMQVLSVLGHSIPLRSSRAFRTRSILRQQTRLGRQTFHLTNPRQSARGGPEEVVDCSHFCGSLAATGAGIPGMAKVALVNQTRSRLHEVSRQVQSHLLQLGPGDRLLQAGGRRQAAARKARAAALDAADKGFVTGKARHARAQRHCDLLDVLTCPRQGMRLTEFVTPFDPVVAMAQGRPLMARGASGHLELIHYGGTGLAFKAGKPRAKKPTLPDVLGRHLNWPYLRAQGRRFVPTERNWCAHVLHLQAPGHHTFLRASNV